MIGAAGAPPGFEVVRRERATLVVAAELRAAFEAAGLDRPAGWLALLRSSAGAAGRGATGWATLDGRGVVLKQLRRGGWAGPLWRERFAGAARLRANLVLPIEASARGVATSRPLGLLGEEGPAGLWRGWIAFEELPGVRDLATLLVAPGCASLDELTAVLRSVRRAHDVGLEHRDLNAGNLLLRGGPGGPIDVFVIDLDRARLHAGALPLRLRRRGLRRLERSCSKIRGAAGLPGGLDFEHACRLYAVRDDALLAGLLRGRSIGRLVLAAHRLSWRMARRA